MSRSLAAAAALAVAFAAATADAGNGWQGKRSISRQRPNDLFYNYYVGPQPSGTAAQMYVSPRPVPASMGHTYTTYQPFMPHEYLYGHHRSYYTHHPGAGWTRTNVSYRTSGGGLQSKMFHLFDDSYVGWLRGANFFDELDFFEAFDR